MLTSLQLAPAAGVIVKAGTGAVVKYAPKVAPHVFKQVPKNLKKVPNLGTRVAGLMNYLRGFRPGQIKKLLPWAEAILVGWGIRDAADTLSDEFRGVDWEEVAEEDVEDAATEAEEEEEEEGEVEEEVSDESSESAATPDPVIEAGLTGGGSQFDPVKPVPTEPDSVEAGENTVDPDELTLEQLDQIEAGINPVEQEFGNSPDPSLNPFFEKDESDII